MDNVYLIYYVTEYSNSETFNSGRHIWTSQHGGKKIGYRKDKKLVFLLPANEAWDKVIFLHLSVILFTGGVCLSACWDTTPWEQTPPGPGTSWKQTPPGPDTPPWEQTPPRPGTAPCAVHAGR